MRTNRLFIALAMTAFAGTTLACTHSDSDSDSGDLKVKTVKSALSHEDSKITDAQLNAFVKGQYDLNFDIMKKAESDLAGENAMISTFSIQNTLAMVWAGAAGDTADQMKTALRFDENTHQALNKLSAVIKSKNLPAEKSEYYSADAVEVSTTNDLYFAPEHTWRSSWLDMLAVNYDAGIQEMNFAKAPDEATKFINDVVAKDTHDRIQNLIPDGAIDASTQLVLTNAIYLKAPWAAEFDKADEKMSFTKLDKSAVETDMIQASSFFDYVEGDNYQAALIPLRKRTFSVMFVLPNEGEFDAVQNSLSSDMVESIFANVDRETYVSFYMPTFEFRTELEMSSTFQSMGMVDAFSSKANFSGMTEDPNEMYISAIFHKSFIAMNEDGVEAAAATAAIMAENGMVIGNKVSLSLDRPFIFIIYETDSKTPLFFGRVLDPTK